MRFFIPTDWKVLVLDDDLDRVVWFKQRLPDALFAQTADEAIKLLEDNSFQAAFLDHDLHWTHIADIGIFKGTGREVAGFMQKIRFKGSVVIHSRNVLGAAMMHKYLPQAQVSPYGEFEVQLRHSDEGL